MGYYPYKIHRFVIESVGLWLIGLMIRMGPIGFIFNALGPLFSFINMLYE